MPDPHALPDVLRLDPVGDDRFAVTNVGDPAERDVVFGGQILAQSVVAAARRHPGKKVRSLHAVFSRVLRVSEPVELLTETDNAGRSFASESVSAMQGGRRCVRSLLLLDTDDPDVIRHQSSSYDVGDPASAAPLPLLEKVFPGSELRVVGGVDTGDPNAPTGPAALDLWTRCPGLADDAVVNQAVLAYATVGFLVRTALRPHPGLGGDLVHEQLSTSVLSHTVTFHEPALVSEWLLLRHTGRYAGRGRAYGEVEVIDGDGHLVASAVQECMIRAFPGRGAHESHDRALM